MLQAADVLAYQADEVPVGDDQRQHVELMREIARRFNERFGETLVEPEHRIPEVGARIMDLQNPDNEDGDDRRQRAGDGAGARRARRGPQEDQERGHRLRLRGPQRGEGKEGIANLIDILAVVRGADPDEIESEFEGSGYGDFKGAVADEVVEFLAPVRERYDELRPDEAALERALAAGAEKAREIARPVLAEVREAMGVGPA